MWRVGYDHDVSIAWTQSPPDLHQRTWLMRSVDFISEIERSQLISNPINRGSDKWTHLDATMEIRRRKWQDHEIVAYNQHAIVAVDRSSPYQTACVFRAEIPYKYRCSYVSLTLD